MQILDDDVYPPSTCQSMRLERLPKLFGCFVTSFVPTLRGKDLIDIYNLGIEYCRTLHNRFIPEDKLEQS